MIKTGDTVRDGQGTSWQVGQFLGRGTWAKAWAVRRESDDATFVMKCALGPEDFRGVVPAAEVVYAASREAVLEQARVLAEARHPCLPRLETRLSLGDNSPAYVIPRFPESLERRLQEGMVMSDLVEVATAVARLVQALPGGHGGIKATNILFNDRNEIFLTDLATASVQRTIHRFTAASPGEIGPYPPEITETEVASWPGGVDGWALTMLLWRGAVSGSVVPNAPRAGFDKAAQGALRDHLTDRMKKEDSNPRFHNRFSERVVVLLARGLSRETSPSPPYRFARLDELITRLEEVGALIRPQVSTVGKVILDRPQTKPFFSTEEQVAFTCTVGTSAGVEGPEEIGVGLAVFDVDKDERLKDLDLAYSVDKHPGAFGPNARYRFAFKITGLGPGRYKIRIAFAIRDSGQPPTTVETDATVIAAPGWVPRAGTTEPAPIPFQRDPEPTGVTQVSRLEASAPIASPRPRPTPPGLRESETPPEANGPRPVPPSAPPEPTGARAASVGPTVATKVEPTRVEPARRDLGGRSPIATPVETTASGVSETPVYKPPPRKDWVDEALPNASTRDLDEADDLHPDDDEEDGEPGPLARVLHQLRTDPYSAVMAGLGFFSLVLLVVFLLIRE